MSFWTINPATEERIREYSEDSINIINNKIELTNKAFNEWKQINFDDRSALMIKTALLLREKKDKVAMLMAEEMGKPLFQGLAEVEKCASVCEFYALRASEYLRREDYQTEMSKSYVVFKPMGVILAVMPWNYPFWQVFRFAAPALMAGNAGILKHSPNTIGCAIEIENIFKEAGFPENLFTNLIIGKENVPEYTKQVIENPLVAAVTLTGSTYAGMQVASIAGMAIKKTVLELGGSDPYIVLSDADLEKTVEACTTGRLINAGQSCIAAKRMIVHQSIINDFIDLLKKSFESKKMGDPNDPNTYIGPLARNDLRDNLHRQVKLSIKLGAEAVLGCELPTQKGYYYPPSILKNVTREMPAFNEELFGPVASIISFETENEAVEIANDHIYGLGGAIFTNDIEKGEYIASELINSGSLQVNDFTRSDPRLPFGGIKQSGYGRELSSYGIREFVNIKTVCVR